MPDTPGKRQRDAAKAKKREAKEERRAARKAAALDPTPRPDDEQTEGSQRTEGDDLGEPRPEP
jgi:hypothetical protein